MNIYGNDLIGRYEPGDDTYFYIKDHLGSTRVVVNSDGNVDECVDYYPFGMAYRNVTSANETLEKFTGKKLGDEEGLDWYYFGARYYNPVVGKFLSVDSHADLCPSLTPYHYVRNNPLNMIDPTGMDTLPTGHGYDSSISRF